MDFFDILLAKKLEDDRDPTIEGLSVTENGIYSEENKAYNPVIVEVPEPTLISKSITANGTYSASGDNADGYSSVTVAVEGFKVKDMPAGAISSFNDGTDNPLKELKVSIVPVQSGSGDPSPSNPRAISGWTGANIGVNGKNFCNIGSASFTRYERYPLLLPSGTYTLSSAITSTDTEGNDCYFGIYDASGSLLIGERLTRNDRTSHTFTLSSNSSYIILYAGHNSSQSVGDDATWANIQIEVGSTATTYEPYNGTTATISLGQTVYGGELDVTSGILKARPYYASYNGETLVGPWISSLDEYEEGATPTTGAQVVDLGGTETTYQLTPTQVSSILGTNNIWADCGDVISGKYFASL